MHFKEHLQKLAHEHSRLAIRLVSLLVAAHGVFILVSTLSDQLRAGHGSRLSDIVVDLPLLIGLGLVYLSTLLRRQKRTAWVVTLRAYVFYFGLTVAQVLPRIANHSATILDIVRSFVLPVLIISLLFLLEKEFVVKSDRQTFRGALRFVALVIAATFAYGVLGFVLLDRSDFHQEIGFPTAAHYTIDQFDLTTTHPVQPISKRAHLFVDSLRFVSIASVGYIVISFFQPLRSRFSDQTKNRQHMQDLLQRYGAPSEDFFKLWPHDKQYFFDETGNSGLAFHVARGVALVLADPVGDPKHFKALFDQFSAICFSNDWLPALVHVENTHVQLYEKQGFTLQKLGEEPVLDILKFKDSVLPDKYFRQINNKFTKHGYASEILTPPHHDAIIRRLKEISDEWLSRGGRVERQFVMGYFDQNYLQQCEIIVVRDAASTIQAFANLVPADFDKTEATFDMLRQSNSGLSNINDFLLIELINHLESKDYERLNLGLCPLVGLDDTDKDDRNLVDGVLRFVYSNGDRFYSFSGLYKFKAKYGPEWRPRYIGYQRGVRGFSRTMNALMKAMRVRKT